MQSKTATLDIAATFRLVITRLNQHQQAQLKMITQTTSIMPISTTMEVPVFGNP